MDAIQQLEERYIINTYGRRPSITPCLVKGRGAYVWDETGKRYLDFLSGLAVNVVGHCHPEVVRAISEQSAELIHTSNLYYSAPQAELAKTLVENSLPGGKVFFANSGAEANEAAIKLARKYRPGRYKVISAERSFHGRTLAALSATGQEKYRTAFEPLVEGFSYARFNDLDSFHSLVDERTAAIIIEPVQGEGGVHVAADDFIRGLRSLCDQHGILLVFDEVQCGMGRTGKLWAFQNWDVIPDLLTAAKGLGGGLPIGAMIASEPYAAIFQPGDHASTFGGNPVVCSAARAVLKILTEENFQTELLHKGTVLKSKLKAIASDYPELIKEYRGMGLICALELKQPLARQIQEKCTAAGLLLNAIGEKIIRFLPPLTVTAGELNEGVTVLESVLKEAGRAD